MSKNKLYTVLPFVIGIVEKVQNERRFILLGKHPNKPTKPFPGFYDLPGGKIEKGESIRNAMKRELKEETGLSVSYLSTPKTFHFTRKYYKNSPNYNGINGLAICFWCKISNFDDFDPKELEDLDFVPTKTLNEKYKKNQIKLTPWADKFLHMYSILK